MIEGDLADGPGSPLVRGPAARLASVTETRLAALPEVGDAPVEHALGA
jgi:hypothetical protein